MYCPCDVCNGTAEPDVVELPQCSVCGFEYCPECGLHVLSEIAEEEDLKHIIREHVNNSKICDHFD